METQKAEKENLAAASSFSLFLVTSKLLQTKANCSTAAASAT
jgi:hypothetical protein